MVLCCELEEMVLGLYLIFWPSYVMTRHLRHHRENIIAVERIWEIWKQHPWMSCARSIGGKEEKLAWEILYIYQNTGHGAKSVNKDHASGQIGQLGWWNDGQVQTTQPVQNSSPLHCSTWHTQHGRQHSARFFPILCHWFPEEAWFPTAFGNKKKSDRCKRQIDDSPFQNSLRHIQKCCS